MEFSFPLPIFLLTLWSATPSLSLPHSLLYASLFLSLAVIAIS